MQSTDWLSKLKDAITFSQAAKLCPTRPAVNQIRRWHERGVRGVKLEAWLVGGKKVTTLNALSKFLSDINSRK